jgi:RNA polymerase sigma-32 factor
MIAREYQRRHATCSTSSRRQHWPDGGGAQIRPYRGIRFPSYAVWWVRAYMIRYLINNWRVVKLGTTQAQRKLFFNLQKEKDAWRRRGSCRAAAHRPTARREGVGSRRDGTALASRDLSIDQPSDDETGATLLDVLPSRVQPRPAGRRCRVRKEIGEKIHAFGATLKDKEAVIFSERLLAEQPLTLQEIGDKYGISRERVRQIEERLKRACAPISKPNQRLHEGALDFE